MLLNQTRVHSPSHTSKRPGTELPLPIERGAVDLAQVSPGIFNQVEGSWALPALLRSPGCSPGQEFGYQYS
jgi:hypothetical protein